MGIPTTYHQPERRFILSSSWPDAPKTGALEKPKHFGFKHFFTIPALYLNIGNRDGADKTKHIFNANTRLRDALLYFRNKTDRTSHRVTVKNADLMKMAALNDRAFSRARVALVDAGIIAATPTDKRQETYEYEFLKTINGMSEPDAEQIEETAPEQPKPEESIGVPIPREVTEGFIRHATTPDPSLAVAPKATYREPQVAEPTKDRLNPVPTHERSAEPVRKPTTLPPPSKKKVSDI
jgi:hypothetical protein